MTKKYYVEVRKVEGNTKGSYQLETTTNIENLYRVSDIEKEAQRQFDYWTRDSKGKIPRHFRMRVEFKE